jgi:hypothetical protein
MAQEKNTEAGLGLKNLRISMKLLRKSKEGRGLVGYK